MKKKKLLSLLLAGAMTLSLLPGGRDASAVEETEVPSNAPIQEKVLESLSFWMKNGVPHMTIVPKGRDTTKPAIEGTNAAVDTAFSVFLISKPDLVANMTLFDGLPMSPTEEEALAYVAKTRSTALTDVDGWPDLIPSKYSLDSLYKYVLMMKLNGTDGLKPDSPLERMKSYLYEGLSDPLATGYPVAVGYTAGWTENGEVRMPYEVRFDDGLWSGLDLTTKAGVDAWVAPLDNTHGTPADRFEPTAFETVSHVEGETTEYVMLVANYQFQDPPFIDFFTLDAKGNTVTDDTSGDRYRPPASGPTSIYIVDSEGAKITELPYVFQTMDGTGGTVQSGQPLPQVKLKSKAGDAVSDSLIDQITWTNAKGETVTRLTDAGTYKVNVTLTSNAPEDLEPPAEATFKVKPVAPVLSNTPAVKATIKAGTSYEDVNELMAGEDFWTTKPVMKDPIDNETEVTGSFLMVKGNDASVSTLDAVFDTTIKALDLKFVPDESETNYAMTYPVFTGENDPAVTVELSTQKLSTDGYTGATGTATAKNGEKATVDFHYSVNDDPNFNASLDHFTFAITDEDNIIKETELTTDPSAVDDTHGLVEFVENDLYQITVTLEDNAENGKTAEIKVAAGAVDKLYTAPSIQELTYTITAESKQQLKAEFGGATWNAELTQYEATYTGEAIPLTIEKAWTGDNQEAGNVDTKDLIITRNVGNGFTSDAIINPREGGYQIRVEANTEAAKALYDPSEPVKLVVLPATVSKVEITELPGAVLGALLVADPAAKVSATTNESDQKGAEVKSAVWGGDANNNGKWDNGETPVLTITFQAANGFTLEDAWENGDVYTDLDKKTVGAPSYDADAKTVSVAVTYPTVKTPTKVTELDLTGIPAAPTAGAKVAVPTVTVKDGMAVVAAKWEGMKHADPATGLNTVWGVGETPKLVLTLTAGDNMEFSGDLISADGAKVLAAITMDGKDVEVKSARFENTDVATVILTLTYPEVAGGGGSADPEDMAAVVFYDWDDTLLGSIVVPKGQDVESAVNAFVQSKSSNDSKAMKESNEKYYVNDPNRPLTNKEGYTFSKWLDYNSTVPTHYGASLNGTNQATEIPEPTGNDVVDFSEGIQDNTIVKACYQANDEVIYNASKPTEMFYTTRIVDVNRLGISANFSVDVEVSRGNVSRLVQPMLKVAMGTASGTVYSFYELKNTDVTTMTVYPTTGMTSITCNVVDFNGVANRSAALNKSQNLTSVKGTADKMNGYLWQGTVAMISDAVMNHEAGSIGLDILLDDANLKLPEGVEPDSDKMLADIETALNTKNQSKPIGAWLRLTYDEMNYAIAHEGAYPPA